MVEINVPRIGDINTKTKRITLIVFKFFIMSILYMKTKQKHYVTIILIFGFA